MGSLLSFGFPPMLGFNFHELRPDEDKKSPFERCFGAFLEVAHHTSRNVDEILVANMEFVLHGLAAYNEIGQSVVGSDVTFGDLIGNLFEPDNEED